MHAARMHNNTLDPLSRYMRVLSTPRQLNVVQFAPTAIYKGSFGKVDTVEVTTRT